MQHMVSLSGGASSAVAAQRVLDRYGTATLWFADTKYEDADLYRFLDDLEHHFGQPILRHVDGRTPYEVAEQKQLIPNQRRAPCTLALKIKPFLAYLKSLTKPCTVHFGFHWMEIERTKRPKAEYETIPGVTVDFPLLWEPVANPPFWDTLAAWGIEIPALYKLGFSHNNCGGRCVKQGVKDWLRLRQHRPDDFARISEWEAAQRSKPGARQNYALLRDQSRGRVTPLPLTELEQRYPAYTVPFGMAEDSPACLCGL